MSKHELPHGAHFDHETEQISLPIGSVTLNFSFEEWSAFFDIVDDVNTVIQMNTIESFAQCPSCHTVVSFVQYEEPQEDEIN